VPLGNGGISRRGLKASFSKVYIGLPIFRNLKKRIESISTRFLARTDLPRISRRGLKAWPPPPGPHISSS